MLDTMCLNIDGFLKFITKFYIDFIYFGIARISHLETVNQTSYQNINFFDKSVISRSQLQPLVANYSGGVYPSAEESFLNHQFKILTNDKYALIFKNIIINFSIEDLIEQPLQVFSCISYHISDEKSLEKFMEDKFDYINHYLIAINNLFLRAKVCNFYSFNLDSFYHDQENILSKSFDDSINFLFHCLLKEDQNLNLNYTALESLDPLIFEKSVTNVVKDFVVIYSKNIFNMLNNKKFIKITDTLKFRDFINNLINHFADEITHCSETVFEYFWGNLLLSVNEFLLEKAKLANIKNLNNLKKLNSVNKHVIMDESVSFNSNVIDLVDFSEQENTNIIANYNNEEFHKNFEIKTIQLETGIFNTLEILLDKIKHIPSKIQIYQKIFSLMNHLKHLIDFYHEEEILDMIKIAIHDIKLIPDPFLICLENLLSALEPRLNLLLQEGFNLESFNFKQEYNFENDQGNYFYLKFKDENKIQTYHINFIFSFLKNVKFEDTAVSYYKQRIFMMSLFNLYKNLHVFKTFNLLDSLDKKEEVKKNTRLNIGLYIKMLYCYIIVILNFFN